MSEHLTDTNVGNIEYIRKEDAIDTVSKACFELRGVFGRCEDAIKALPPADVLPYSIDPDGTLTVTVPKGTEVSRVLVQEEGTQWGGLFYAD